MVGLYIKDAASDLTYVLILVLARNIIQDMHL